MAQGKTTQVQGKKTGTALGKNAVRQSKAKPKVAPLTPESLQAACAALGCPVPEQAYSPLLTYLSLLMQWNTVMNLVGTHSWRETLESLLADSFYLAEFLQSLALPAEPECWDLGAGAGLPGIPLRMVWQQGHYTLVEAREKRALFLSTVVARAGLSKTAVFRGRAEAFFAQAQPADVVVSRAFLPWQEVLAFIEPHIQPTGLAIFLTLEPMPARVPAGWCAVQQQAYAIEGDTRYFWALQRQA